jgi:cell division protease FtsH
MKKYQTTGVWILTILVLTALFVTTLFFQGGASVIKELGYSRFVEKVEADRIKSVTIAGNVAEAIPTEADLQLPAGTVPQTASGSTRITRSEDPAKTGQVTTPADGKPSAISAKPDRQPPLKYRVLLPERNYEQDLLPRLKKHNVEFDFETPQSSGQWLGILSTVFLPLLIVVFFVILFRNVQSGGSQAMAFGKSKAKMMLDNKVKITFKDVAGIDEAKAELEEVVDFLKNGERYQKLGARIPKGVLLVGSPGTGKTLLAKAVAGEAGVPFFSISGSDFVEMFVGVGASRVRDLFDQAKKHAPCIVFVDEIDAVGRQRGAGLGGGHDEREQTLNQLLVEMDGFDATTGIIIVAATNRPDILDNALLRPGRFDRQVVIDRPDVLGREQILNVHGKGKPLAPNVDLKSLAKQTPGFTGADLSNLINEGALLAARQNKEVIDMRDLEMSIEKVLAGSEKKSKIISEKDKEITAYHEVGHALVHVMNPDASALRKVSIIPRGMALGLTWSLPEEDQVHMTRNQLYAHIATLLGGRVAEETVFGDVTTGASNDLERVTSTARKIVMAYGMSSKLGLLTFGSKNEHPFMGRDFGTERDYSEEVATLIDKEIKEIVDTQYQWVKQLLTENRDLMDAIVKVLLEKETLDDKEVMDIINRVKADRGETHAVTS